MNKKNTYEIVMEGDPKKPTPVLYDKGKHIGSNDIIYFNKNKDGMKKHEYYVLRFEIRDFKDSVLRFVPDTADMFWAQPGTVCPTTRKEIPGVLWQSDHDQSGEWIEVTNSDMSELEFRFALNFSKKGLADPAPSDYVSLDPGGMNQNGGIGGKSDTLAFAVVGAFSAGATAIMINQGFDLQPTLLYALGGALFGLLVGALASLR